MNSNEIFSYSEPKDVLNWVFEEKKSRNAQFSIRAWARRLGFKNPSMLSDVLSGRRSITTDFAFKVSDSLGLTDQKRNYFETLVFLKNAKSDEEKTYYGELLQQLLPKERQQPFDMEKAPLREWYHWILDEIVCLEDFKEDYDYLSQRMGGSVSASEIKTALEDLERFGLLSRDKSGKLCRPYKNQYSGKLDQELLDRFRVKALDLAVQKFKKRKEEPAREGGVTVRAFNNAVPVRRKDYQALCEAFRAAARSMNDFESPRDAEDIVLVGAYVFPLTQPVERGTKCKSPETP